MNKMSKIIYYKIRGIFSSIFRWVRRIIPKPILSAIRYLLKTLMRFPYWTYHAVKPRVTCGYKLFRKYIPGYEASGLLLRSKKLPHYLQEGVAILMCFVTVLVGTGLSFLFNPFTVKNTDAAW